MASVSRPWLLTEPRAVQRRVLKEIGEQAGIPLEFKHIEDILRFAAEDGPAGKELSLPLGWKLVREPEAMVFLTPDLRREERIPDYEYRAAASGTRFRCRRLGVVIEALRITLETAPKSQFAEYNPQQLLRAESVAGAIDCAELACGRPVLAGAYESAEEDQGTAAGTACGPARAQALAGRGERRRRLFGCAAFRFPRLCAPKRARKPC